MAMPSACEPHSPREDWPDAWPEKTDPALSSNACISSSQEWGFHSSYGPVSGSADLAMEILERRLDAESDREVRRRLSREKRAAVAAQQRDALDAARSAFEAAAGLLSLAPADYDWALYESAETNALAAEKARERGYAHLAIAQERSRERAELYAQHLAEFVSESHTAGRPGEKATIRISPREPIRRKPLKPPYYENTPEHCNLMEPCLYRSDGIYECWCPTSPGVSDFEEAHRSGDIQMATSADACPTAAAPEAAHDTPPGCGGRDPCGPGPISGRWICFCTTSPTYSPTSPSYAKPQLATTGTRAAGTRRAHHAIHVAPKAPRKRHECRICHLPMSEHTRDKKARWVCPVSDTYPQHYDF